MELYVEPKWAKKEKERKPHPLKGKHQWITDDPEKRQRVIDGLRKGWLSKKGKTGRISPIRVPVSVYNLDGTFVAVCSHIHEAADRFGGTIGNIHSCMNGHRGRCGQYQFRKAQVVEFQGKKLVKKTPIEPYRRRNRKPNLITN